MHPELLVAMGAGLGAPARYLLDREVKKFHRTLIPFETLVINTIGSIILGYTVHQSHSVAMVLGTGFAGAFTTWSAFAVETHHLIKESHRLAACGYLLATLILGVAGAALGNHF